MRGRKLQVGVLSDTHGLFDEKLVGLFFGVDLILHAGDVCGQHVLDRLASIAPVRAVSGNNDTGALSLDAPEWRTEDLAGYRILILHQLGKPEHPSPVASRLIAARRPDIVVSGHSHQGRVDVRQGMLFLNPGGAGRKRFRLLRSAALLSLAPREAKATLFSLEAPRPTAVAEAVYRPAAERQRCRIEPASS